MMRQYLEQALEDIDASIFTGDVLHNDEERAEIKQYIKRWQKALAEHEKAANEKGRP